MGSKLGFVIPVVFSLVSIVGCESESEKQRRAEIDSKFQKLVSALGRLDDLDELRSWAADGWTGEGGGASH